MFGAAWRTFQISTKDGEILFEQKFQRPSFKDLFTDKTCAPLIMEFYDGILTQTFGQQEVCEDTATNPDLDEEGNTL